ncbi:MAG: tripartite tricarboxylate transporter permease, partial [Halobacteriales archaeon]|nr:tripartite tricarboxylate transporter permease [Halobacteriales archaeon]
LALRSPPPPPQPVLPSAMPARKLLATGGIGGACGALAGLLPGLSTSAGSVLAGVVRPGGGHEESLVTLSAAASSEAVLGALALVLLGRARSGAMLAVQQLVPPAPSAWPLMLAGLLAGLAMGVPVALLTARALAPRFHRMPYRGLSAGTLLALVLLTWCFTGLPGMALLGLSALAGVLPWFWGVRRGHLMGCLLGPLLLASWG